jgi:hypothetical protein
MRIPATYVGGLPGWDQPVAAGELFVEANELCFEYMFLEGTNLKRERLFALGVPFVAGIDIDPDRLHRFAGTADIYKEGGGFEDGLFGLAGGLINIAYAQTADRT